MFFDTPAFVVFLIVVVTLYWRLPFRAQNVALLIASYFFYGWWDCRFLGLMLISTIMDFYLAKLIRASDRVSRRRLFLVLSLTLNFGFLGFFKYFNFFADSLLRLIHQLGIASVNLTLLQVVLPPGISFYTFQAVAYIVDVYHRKIRPADSLLDYALFISLFPHLIAGPIQRPSHLLPQVQNPRRFDESQFFDGLLLILSGFFRKCVVADNCALIANAAFAGRLGPPGLCSALIGTYAFAWQIYGDFSGYSDIARGAAQLLGFHFMVNFRQPYMATSLRDFWRRWHVSLSTWLRDYLYVPLGGSKEGQVKTCRNLMTTMLLGGLWHGANWTFVVWGGIHGAWLSLERIWEDYWKFDPRAPEQQRSTLAAWANRILVFHLVCLCWVFFRADSLSSALHYLSQIGTLGWDQAYVTALALLGLFAGSLFVVDLAQERSGEEYMFQLRSPAFRIATAIVLLTVITLFTASEPSAFIYFQF